MPGTPLSWERENAKANYPADMQTYGLHNNGEGAITVTSPNQFIAKPLDTDRRPLATHIKLQALTQNIRYKIDNGTTGATPATATDGFQLAAGADSLIPVPNTGISIAPEVAGAIIQYQWMR